ncbi:hypothetical protein KSF_013150 [Reticulibacter mediterranei]|uniref:Uncharacterized protein n=1 Tax=Reticulibacter mediterranei TaxID=2778369 RepID=A0A8J3MYW2_9CHLR|nr:hypothetical protein KSF_013150 [Reticulibacter mediterranei]
MLRFIGGDHPSPHSSLFLRKYDTPDQRYKEAEDNFCQSTEKSKHYSTLLSMEFL